MANIINVKPDQDTIKLFGTEYLIDKNKLAKDGEYELKAFGDVYVIKGAVKENKPESGKNKQK